MFTKSILLICVFDIISSLADETTQSSVKIVVDDNLNSITHRPNRVKPTSATVEHKPGVPPGWENRPHFNPQGIFATLFPSTSTEKLEQTTKYSPVTRPVPLDIFNELNVTGPPLAPPEAVVAEPNKNSFFDWILGAIGIRPNPPNANTVPDPEIPQIKCPDCSCGEVYKHTRIVGGQEVHLREFTWIGYLTFNGRFFCAGSLITNWHVLTAAHCVNSFSKKELGIIFNDHDRSKNDETVIIKRNIANILKHENYNKGGSYNNDIAILKLDHPIEMNKVVQPICLPDYGRNFTGFTGKVIGWGAIREGGPTSNKLREVDVPIVSNYVCRTSTPYKDKITDNMMCAGYLGEGKKDSCQGDSGGPLQVKFGNKFCVAGVVSWGEGCAQKDYPGVYTRVNRYLSWIDVNTKNACRCKI